MVDAGATAATVFPVVSGYDLEGVVVDGLVIEGNKGENPPLNGCRGAGIFLYRGFGTVIRDCVVRGYNGDGISFQQSNDVQVERCSVEGNAGLGFHPGSGSQRPTVRESVARANGEDGLFLCWRVKYGLFENNLLENNGRFGVSIGHKDTDNLFRNNRVLANHHDGIYFRNESDGMAGHRNEFVGNLVENNGKTNDAAAIRVRGATRDLVFRDNVLRETRPEGERRQTAGVIVEDRAGNVAVEGNRVENAEPLVDRRK
jgi:nitrous oxidase accessory protein NosD